jgi:hypothetical protein
MQRSASEQIVLICEECGERLIILGSEEDWRSRCTIFVCECSHKLSLEPPPDEEILAAS